MDNLSRLRKLETQNQMSKADAERRRSDEFGELLNFTTDEELDELVVIVSPPVEEGREMSDQESIKFKSILEQAYERQVAGENVA